MSKDLKRAINSNHLSNLKNSASDSILPSLGNRKLSGPIIESRNFNMKEDIFASMKQRRQSQLLMEGAINDN